MYSKLPNLVLAFHGCDKSVADMVLQNGKHLRASSNAYDWLGHGIYFWEQNYDRAFEWASESKKIKTPAVVGAVIDLGYCLNLTDSASEIILKRGYEFLKFRCEITDEPLPKNRLSKSTSDVLLRDLDCAVIQHVHELNKVSGQKAFDSVRGIFVEGKEPYPGSEFRIKTHVQLCIVNPNCIKGYFRPLRRNNHYDLP